MLKKQIITVIFSIMPFINIYSQQIVDISTFERCFDDTCNANKYYKDLNNRYDKFLGIWENTTGNMTFKVTVSKKEFVKNPVVVNSYADEIVLKYMMIKDKGLSTESIIYRSDKNFMNTNQPWGEVFRTQYASDNSFGSLIIDNCIPTNPKRAYIMGKLRFEFTTSTNPITAHWTVKKMSGMHLSDEPDFTIPKDIILTKQ